MLRILLIRKENVKVGARMQAFADE